MSQKNTQDFFSQGIGVKQISEVKKIEKIVYSLWTSPSGNILENAVNWTNPRSHLLCLALSVNIAKKHFKKIELVTDSEGWNIIKKINLPFTSVKTILDDIPKKQYGFWALGKIYAYQCQDEPFVHLDNDAILWKGLPDWALEAPVFVQNTEDKDWFQRAYMGEINHANNVLNYFPPMWGKVSEAFCTGIFGGTDVEFIKDYCNEVLKFLNDPRNKQGWNSITNKGSYCIVFEQYLLALMTTAHNKEVVFFDKYLNSSALENMGYTHIWGAKKNKEIEKMLEKSIKKHSPKSLKYIDKLFKKNNYEKEKSNFERSHFGIKRRKSS